MSHRCTLAAACLAVAAAQHPAAAQTPPAPAASTPQLDTVTIRPNAERDERRESTANKIVVTREDLTRYGDANVVDVLKRLPGVSVGNAAGGRVGVEIRLRGLGNGYTSILLNGEPTAPGFSIDSISPDLIERIELFRTATADKSAQAIAGTINIVLKQVVRQAQKEVKAALSSEGGRAGGAVSVQLSDRAEGGLSYVLGADLKREASSGHYTVFRRDTNAQGQVIGERFTESFNGNLLDTLTLTPRLNWTVDARDTLSADAFVQYQKQSTEWPDRYTTVSGPPSFLQAVKADTRRESGTVRGRLNWTRKLEDAAQIEAKLGLSESRRSQKVGYDSLDGAGTLQRRRTVDGPASDTSVTFSGKYRAPFMTSHTLSVGWDGERARREESRVQTDLTPTGLLIPVNLSENFDARVNRLALFVQDEWELSQRWSVYQGLRWEGIDTRTLGNGFDTVANRSRVLSPILQSVWKVPDTKSDQVRLGLSRTYKAPTTRDLSPRRGVGWTENTATSPDFEGNTSLRPELAWGLDLAYERYVGDGGVLSSNVYARRIRDVIQQEISFDSGDGLWISRPVNAGKASTYGIELEAKGNLRKVLEAGPALDVRLNVARNWSRVEAVPGPNNRLAQQTPWSANLGADWRPDGTPLTLGASFGLTTGGLVRLLGNQTASRSVNRQLDAYGLWKIDAQSQLRLSFGNLLRQEQVWENSHSDANGSLEQTTRGRFATTVRLGLELKI
jgi:outer membrane receptor protein involved in Fe transport